MITTQTNVYDSSTVEASTYVFKTQTLYITFKHATYIYEGVSEEDYNAFANAESQGKSLNSLIKGKYEYKKSPESTE